MLDSNQEHQVLIPIEIHLEGEVNRGILTNSKTNDMKFKTQLQHTMCNQEWARIPVKGSGTTPRDSSKLRVEVLYETLLV